MTSENIQNSRSEAETRLSNAVTQGTQGRFALMRQEALDALGLYRETGDKFGEGRALEVLSFAEGLLGNLDEKLNVLNGLITTATEARDNFDLARAKTEIGNVHLTRRQTNLAEQSLKEVEEILPKLTGNERRWAEWWYTSYSAKLNVQKFEESGDQIFLDQARASITRMDGVTDKDSTAEMAHLSIVRGFVEGMGKNLELAKTEFENAKRLFQQVGHPFGIGEVDYFHAYVLLKSGSLAEGSQMLDLAEQEFKNLGENIGLSLVNELRKNTTG